MSVGYFQPASPVTSPYGSPYAAQASARPQIASHASGGGVMQALSQGDMVDKGQAIAHIWNMGATGVQGGRAVNPAFGALFRALKGLKGNGIFSGLKGVVGATLPFLQRSALFEAAISAVANGIRLFQGRIGFGEFAGRVTADGLSGAVGGVGAALGGALVLALLPFTGTMATIFAAIGGIAGYSMASGAFKGTSFYRKIIGTVRNAFGGY